MFTEHKMTYIERIVDATTGEETLRDYTAKEIAEVEKAIADNEARAKAQATKAAEKAALLAKLGITDDEAKLLLS
jgi:acyl-CoA reductase-like NAD-dependent aldehyde dehydrogenase